MNDVWLSLKCGCWIDKTGELHQCDHGNRCYVLWVARTQYVSSKTGSLKHLRTAEMLYNENNPVTLGRPANEMHTSSSYYAKM